MHTFMQILVTADEISAWSKHRAGLGCSPAEAAWMDSHPGFFWMIPSGRNKDIRKFRRFTVSDPSLVIRPSGHSSVVGAPTEQIERFWFHTRSDELSGVARGHGVYRVSYTGYAEDFSCILGLLRNTQGPVDAVRVADQIGDFLIQQGREIQPM